MTDVAPADSSLQPTRASGVCLPGCSGRKMQKMPHASLRSSLETLKVQNLKDVLSALGLVKGGRKQDLIDRITSYCSEDGMSHRTVRVGQLVQRVLGVRGASAAPPAVQHPAAAPPAQQPQLVDRKSVV